jgi:hypothetical protein
MKDRHISYCAIVISILAIGYAAWLHYSIVGIVQRKEAEAVRMLTPAVRDFLSGFGVRDSDLPSDPRTIEELFRPFREEVPKIMKP